MTPTSARRRAASLDGGHAARHCHTTRHRRGREHARGWLGLRGLLASDFFHRDSRSCPRHGRRRAYGAWDGDGHAEPVGTFDGSCSRWSSCGLATSSPPAATSLEAYAVKLGGPARRCPAFSGDGVAETDSGRRARRGCGSSGLAFGCGLNGGAATGPGQRPSEPHGFRRASPWPGRRRWLARPSGGADSPEAGVTWLPKPAAGRGTDLLASPDGKVLLAAAGRTPSSGPEPGSAIVLARLTATGALDSSFGSATGPASSVAGSANMRTEGTSSFRRTARLSSRAGNGRSPRTTREAGARALPRRRVRSAPRRRRGRCSRRSGQLPDVSNPGQEDNDGDGQGNACDTTPDGSGGGGGGGGHRHELAPDRRVRLQVEVADDGRARSGSTARARPPRPAGAS